MRILRNAIGHSHQPQQPTNSARYHNLTMCEARLSRGMTRCRDSRGCSSRAGPTTCTVARRAARWCSLTRLRPQRSSAFWGRSRSGTGCAGWAGEEPSKLPWWREGRDEPVSPREGEVYVDYLGRSTAPERSRLTVEESLDRACGVLDVDVDELASRRREPRLRELRELVAVLGVERYEQQVREIAGRLAKNPGSVSRWVTTAAERRSSDSGFARRLAMLDEALQGTSQTHDS